MARVKQTIIYTMILLMNYRSVLNSWKKRIILFNFMDIVGLKTRLSSTIHLDGKNRWLPDLAKYLYEDEFWKTLSKEQYDNSHSITAFKS